MKKIHLLTLGSICCSLSLAEAQISSEPCIPCQEVPALMQQYKADYQQLYSFYTPHVGNYFVARNTNDVKGGSEEKLQQLKKCNDIYLQKITQLTFSKLPQECKVDYLLFKRNLEEKNREIEESLVEYKSLKPIFAFEDIIYDLGKTRRRGGSFSYEKKAHQFDSIARVLINSANILNQKKFSLTELKMAEGKVNDLETTVEWVDNFYKGYQPMYSWWMKTPVVAMETALKTYQSKIREKEKEFQFQDGSGIVGVPIGRDELIHQLNFEMIPYSPEELIDLANKEFAWCDQEMLKASKEMGFGTEWKKAVEKVKNSYVPIGEQPQLINDLYQQSVDFIKKLDMVTIPPFAEDTWGMDMMPPERQRINPFFTGGNEITISYPTDNMSESDKLMSMRGNNPHFSRSTVFHELIPGHNLEFYYMRRNRTYRDYSTPFWIEGWSLYWELLLWDNQFPRGPEDQIGMLFWRMTRCARIIFSLNYHLGRWSPQQCIDYLVDRVDYERANAEGEVRRSFEGSYSPLYQVGYLVGGQQIYALEKELVDKSKKMTRKQFNDAVMELNAMPIEMVRAILKGEKLSVDYTTKWRFYDK